MRNLKKLFYVACAVLFFASCEETYNDKLFWPGEISQEYGSYIKPYTLNLTYSGEKLTGKTVNFKTENCETGTLTLNGIIPGETTTLINNVTLHESGDKDAYTFSGKNTTASGVTVEYTGNVTPKAMQLSLEVTMSNAASVAKTYVFPERSYTDPSSPSTRQSGAAYIQIESSDEMGAFIAAILPQIAYPILDTMLPYALQSIELEKDGNVSAYYTTDSFDFNEIMEKQSLPDDKFKQWINSRNYAASPKGLAYWSYANNTLLVKLNVPAVISLIAQNSGQELDSKLINGICEALLKSDPIRLKAALSAVNLILNNKVISYILNVDEDTFAAIFAWIKDGIPLEMTQQEEHTYIYLTKESLMPVMKAALAILSEQLEEIGMSADDILGLLAAIDTMNIGLDLTTTSSK